MKHIDVYPNDHFVVVGDGNQYDECKRKFGNVPSIHLEGGGLTMKSTSIMP